MADRRNRIGKPADENTASSSTQSASGLGGGTPEAGPSQPHDEARRIADHEHAIEAGASADEDHDEELPTSSRAATPPGDDSSPRRER